MAYNNENIRNQKGEKINRDKGVQDEAYTKFIKTYTTRLGVYPYACLFNINSSRLEACVKRMLADEGLDDVEVICRYNKKYDQVLRNPGRTDIMVDAFSFFLLISENSDLINKSQNNDYGIPGIRNIQVRVTASEELNKKIVKFIDSNEQGRKRAFYQRLKFGGKVFYAIKLSYNTCMRYAFAVDVRDKDTLLDIMSVRSNKDGFSCRIAKVTGINNNTGNNKSLRKEFLDKLDKHGL